MRGGETIAADLIVLATGYKGQQHLVRKLFGDEVADRVGPIWDFGDEPGTAQHVHPHRAAGPVVHRRQPRAKPHQLEISRAADQGGGGGVAGRESGAGVNSRILIVIARSEATSNAVAAADIESGLLRCARNDDAHRGETHDRLLWARASIVTAWSRTGRSCLRVESHRRRFGRGRQQGPRLSVQSRRASDGGAGSRRKFHHELGRRAVQPRARAAHRRRRQSLLHR